MDHNDVLTHPKLEEGQWVRWQADVDMGIATTLPDMTSEPLHCVNAELEGQLGQEAWINLTLFYHTTLSASTYYLALAKALRGLADTFEDIVTQDQT